MLIKLEVAPSPAKVAQEKPAKIYVLYTKCTYMGIYHKMRMTGQADVTTIDGVKHNINNIRRILKYKYKVAV